MFLIGISGTILPYLVVLGFLLVFSMSMNSKSIDGNYDLDCQFSEKHLTYIPVDKVSLYNSEKNFVADFSSSSKSRQDSRGEQQQMSIVFNTLKFVTFGNNVPDFYFCCGTLKCRQLVSVFSGLSPPCCVLSS